MTSATGAASTAAQRRPLSRSVRGFIALGVAVLLLLGGYGTFALWSSTVSLDGGEVNSGRLELTDATPGVWRDVSAGTPGTVIPDITDFLIVPGDTLTFSSTAVVQAEGDNLEATLAADPASVTGDAVLLADVDITTAVTIGGTPTAVITDANDGDVVSVLVTLAFDEASLNPTQRKSLNLADLELTLTQNSR